MHFFFPEMIGRSHGQYTVTQVQRVSQMCGCYEAALERLFMEISDGDGSHHLNTDQPKPLHYARDLELFAQEYQPDALFDYLVDHMQASWALLEILI